MMSGDDALQAQLLKTPRPGSEEARELGCTCTETRVDMLGYTEIRHELRSGCPVHGIDALPEIWQAVEEARQQADQARPAVRATSQEPDAEPGLRAAGNGAASRYTEFGYFDHDHGPTIH